jgi:hypothetical protein
MSEIYRRTAKGDEEIEKRIYKLDYFHRFVLIMINGKKNSETIISNSSEQWNADQCLNDLEKQGFIVNIVDSPNSISDSSTGDVQQNLIATIQKHLPNNNTKVINKILNADNTHKKLSDAIDSACIFIKLTISEETSKKLKSELHQILDNSTKLK